jgi:hypothetical protein
LQRNLKSTKKNKMKKLFIAAALLIAVNVSAQNNYGQKITPDGAITVKELSAKMNGNDKVEAKVTGKISAVCQEMGCWMKVEKEDGTSMLVRMKDHKFFLPKDVAGKTAIFEGVASVKTLPVETLKDYAADEGKSQAEVDAIKEPKKDVVFEAAGVIVQ